MSDSIDELFAQADEQGEEDRWDFEENPTMKGILIGVSVAPGTQYGPFYVLRIKEELSGNTFGVAVFGTVFNNQVTDVAPKIGAPIGIRYDGLKSNKAGDREYKSWRVVSTEPDFEAWMQHARMFAQKGRPTTQIFNGKDTSDTGANEDYF